MKWKRWIPLTVAVLFIAATTVTVYGATTVFSFYLWPDEKGSGFQEFKEDNEQNAYVTVTSVSTPSAHTTSTKKYWVRVRNPQGTAMTNGVSGETEKRMKLPYIITAKKGSSQVLHMQGDETNTLPVYISGRWCP